MGASPTRLARAPRYLYPMLLRRVAFPDFCEPCLPSPAAKPPAGAGWLHEIKHDGFRMLERRKVLLIRLLAKAPVVGLQVNDHIVEPGDVVFRHACQLGFEGIVSKRLGSPYVSGRSRHWIKNKNPQHPAVKREAEEDWAR